MLHDLLWLKFYIILCVFQDGMLDADEFALSMHLINIKLDGWVTSLFCTQTWFHDSLKLIKTKI